MEIILGQGILCVVVLLGFAALIYLKNNLDRALMKDLLEMRIDVLKSVKKADSCEKIVSKMANDLKKDMESFIYSVDGIRAMASDAKLNTETILKEYEINGIPLGYKRGDNYDAIEGI